MDVIPFIVGVAVWAVLVFLAVRAASSKGRSPVLWGIFAAIIPIVALIIVLVLPRADGGASG
jgi:hypothetical protein